MGRAAPKNRCWQEAELIAGLAQFDLAKALEEATALLPDPKAWEALARAEANTPCRKRPEDRIRVVVSPWKRPLRRRKGGRAGVSSVKGEINNQPQEVRNGYENQ